MQWDLLISRQGKTSLGLGAYILALVAYLSSLVAMAPAHLANGSLMRASGDRLGLMDSRGTLWAGSGQFEVRNTVGQAAIRKGLSWRLLPQHLLVGKLWYEVALDTSARRFHVALSPTQVAVADADAEITAALIGLVIPRLAPFEPRGNLLLHIEKLAINRGGWEGEITLQWRAAGSGLIPTALLGEYELRLKSNGATVRASVRTLQGPLQVAGEGSWAINSPRAFVATISVPQQYQQRLAPVLRMISVEEGAGMFQLELQ